MAFLAPLAAAGAEAAGPAIASGLESVFGPEAAETIAPLAHKALKGLVSSDLAKKGIQKLANSAFGRKATSARALFSKGNKVLGSLTGSTAKQILGDTLTVGKALGVVTDEQAKQVQDAHNQASAIHDSLSHFNKKLDPLSSNVHKDSIKKLVPTFAGPISSSIPEVRALRG